jgi:hypothetical protein
MAICSCGSPARCCQPAVAGGFIYADLRSELNIHLAPQALFSWAWPPLLQAFPFPSTWGRWHCTRFLRPACLFAAHVGSGSSLLSCGVFLPPPLFKLSCSWLLGGCHHSCLLWPSYLFTVPWGIAPPPFFGAQGALSLCYLSFLLLLLIIQFFFSFFPGWWSVYPLGYADLLQGCL